MNRNSALLSVFSFVLFATTSAANAAFPTCQSASSDADGDGYGWENNNSCLVETAAANTQFPTCASASSDHDGDGYGWENNASCMVSATGLIQNDPAGSGSGSGSMPECLQTASDADGDGYGWENNASCVVSATSPIQNDPAGSGSESGSESGSMPECLHTASDADGDGYGWENATSCLVTDNTQHTGPSSATDKDPVNNDPQNDDGDYTSPTTGNTVIRSSSLTSNESVEICTQAKDDWYSWTTVGDFILHTNTWAAWATTDYAWSQCIYTNKNGAQAGVSYDWGTGNGPNDYQVRSYPELIYGIKDEYRGMPKSVTGLPESISNLPGITIDYSMNWPEYGTARAVVASANSRYPNGTIIEGERNVSIESFFYDADAQGNCSESVVSRSEGSNHTYEIMVWLNAGAERLPAGPNDYVTDVTLDGQTYKAYTKNSDLKYIAFVAQNPQQSGSLNWNTFIDWSRQHAHQVKSLFGAQTNSVAMQDDWCMGNIIVGTEIFWGAGNLDFIDWTITQTR